LNSSIVVFPGRHDGAPSCALLKEAFRLPSGNGYSSDNTHAPAGRFSRRSGSKLPERFFGFIVAKDRFTSISSIDEVIERARVLESHFPGQDRSLLDQGIGVGNKNPGTEPLTTPYCSTRY
jgi:hypothetical protein